jgi:hypothetical protein
MLRLLPGSFIILKYCSNSAIVHRLRHVGSKTFGWCLPTLPLPDIASAPKFENDIVILSSLLLHAPTLKLDNDTVIFVVILKL